MNVAGIIQDDMQIGGGAGWVAEQVREARADARAAFDALAGAGNDIPVIGPHPREAAMAAAREAVIHLNEALQVEAPEDAIIDTRHALEELVETIAVLERQGNGIPLRPGEMPTGRFEKAIGLLVAAEHKLMGEAKLRHDHAETLVVDPGLGIGEPVDPDTPRIMGGNGGIVPPWLE